MIHVRWMIRRDLPEVLEIEHDSFAEPWCEDDFILRLRECKTIGMVAEDEDRVVGFMIYVLKPTSLELINFAVHPGHRRRGVGATLVRKLTSKLTGSKRHELVVRISESNLEGQVFLRSQGFLATAVDWGHFDDGRDAYVMRYDARSVV